ncbi:hypothetical protein BROUX41_001759 [Berkeleyomyces rouxiae]|uniref:uncharacterized protein n=1 Tax=Berkeleyomyces rouxiae TaxID=2035830 RepID=UPI003B7FEECC
MAVLDLSIIKPFFTASGPESSQIQKIIAALSMIKYIEGSYFVETDRNPTLVESPFPGTSASEETLSLVSVRPGYTPGFRNASTSIFYLLTPSSASGRFHANRARTIHTLHSGRGRYVLIPPDGRVEQFVVGKSVAGGEKLQWFVEGGAWKASYLLPDDEEDTDSNGLLISETVVPGFEYQDYEFMSHESCTRLLAQCRAKSWTGWLDLERGK